MSTDPESMYNIALLGLRGVSIFWLEEVPKARTQSQHVSFSGWQSNAGATFEFAHIELGCRPSQGNTLCLAGTEAGRLLILGLQQRGMWGRTEGRRNGSD